MRRIYLYNHEKIGSTIFVSGEPAHYLKNVLRMTIGSKFLAFDGSGNEYTLEIKKFLNSKVETKILQEQYSEQKEPQISIELCLCLCKIATFENIIKKAAEIGVSKIIPVKSMRSIFEIDEKKLPAKLERWKKIAAEGSKIAGRTRIPEIKKIENFETIITQDLPAILFWEQSRVPLKDALNNIFSKIQEKRSIAILIGPEGGFTENEVEKAAENHISIASLGPRILSVETASILAIGIAFYELGLFDALSGSL
ncbi:MAG TPA: RsmE family RNA methyltransferase [bacterium]|nr:RsmE family RNA methyltransferase [bacterium]HOL35420.1 RsmE family RNA methyltransferase [bacterium]HPP08801.1 RsmE family RNA methyltransferase [bacterium]